MPKSPSADHFRRALARRITEGRQSVGLTQGQLADALGIPRSSVSDWEQGATCPPLRLVSELATRIRVELGDLLASPETRRRSRDERRRRGRPAARSNPPAS